MLPRGEEMRIAYIMRGVPGSGKSTVARELACQPEVIFSTDNYFYKEGKYCFDPTLLASYHEKNLRGFTRAIEDGFESVVCDNTNVKHEHYEPYARVAREAGYLVVIVTLPHPDPHVAAMRNKHKVPEYSIKKMIANWEA